MIRVDAPVEGHDGVALVTIDRPEARNALSFALLAELAEQLETLDVDERIRVVVITGAGDRAFAAGADIGELADQSPER
ncbi:MAG: enoyl-CoA hydratase/isomerase family protein, partial [Chloroflexi bacterium]|nr:enoyl-CoA hydratase/isomerase family protein [Chloroflexota bacterium]